MKIVFDNIVFALQRAGGISIVWQNLVNGVLNNKSIDKIFLEYPNNNIFRKNILIPNDEIINLSLGFLNHKRYLNPLLKSLKEEFIFHSSYYRTCKNSHAINITTVHDFTYDLFISGFRKKIHCIQRNHAILNSDIIVCISNNTKNDLLRLLPEVDHNKIHVIYNGVSDDYYPIDFKYSKYRNSIMFLGARGGYKNFKFAVESIKSTSYNLLVCGNDLTNNERLYLNNTLGQNRYSVIVHPTNDELNKLYNSVLCLLYPSSYEGFGIPVLEAQRAGCPVIALNASSIPEIIGDNALLINDLSSKEIINKLSLLQNSNIKNEIIEAGLANSKKYSWDKMTRQYIELYDSILA